MRVETSIESLFSQMPPLVKHVLERLPKTSQQPMFRLLLGSTADRSGASTHYDIDCRSKLTLQEVMLEYLPGTFECRFQLLWDGEALDFEEQLLHALQTTGPIAQGEITVRLPEVAHRVRFLSIIYRFSSFSK